MDILVDPEDFPASRKCTYLNTANVCLMYQGAKDAIVEWQTDLYENGSNNFDEIAEANVFDGLHHSAARLINARPEDIAVGSSATELISSLAWAVVPGYGTNVVSTDIVFPSTLYPWFRVARHTNCEIRLAKGQNSYVDPVEVVRLIDDRTAVVCVSHVEYSGGQRYDLQMLADAAHAHGALLVVDATQSAGAIPIDAQGCGFDALVAGGYKWLCGPFGAAVMYLVPHLQDRLDPGLTGFRSNKDMWDLQAERMDFPATAHRFEYSTMAYGCAIGLARSIEYIVDIGVDRIFYYNQYLADMLIDGLQERGIEIVSTCSEAERTSIVAARFPGKDPADVARKLKAAQVMVSARKDFVRFSPHFYNSSADIHTTLDQIDHFEERGFF
jgi:cysteine desulfurase/selenocysteine lyase